MHYLEKYKLKSFRRKPKVFRRKYNPFPEGFVENFVRKSFGEILDSKMENSNQLSKEDKWLIRI